MNSQLEHNYEKFDDRDLKPCGLGKWFWRVMAVAAVIAMALFIVSSIQHIWFTQALINGITG